MQTGKIFHYTSIESLAMILSTGKLRFSRLDSVDDVTEAQTHEEIQFGKYFFVSCWTQKEEDNLAQWKMYGGDMQGVRIELPAYPFRKVRIDPVRGIMENGTRNGPLSNAEIYGRSHMFLAPIDGDKTFAGPVKYVDDVAGFYAAAVSKSVSQDGTQEEKKINGLMDLGRLKSRAWQFQSEYRFVLFALPVDPPFLDTLPLEFTEAQANNVSPALNRGVDPGITSVDIPIDSAMFDKIIIRVGPLCSDGGRVCVEALRDAFAPNAKIEVSPLKGTVRRKP